jgi:predicted ATPase/serine phosphatase RsbU (regulator of sigma subunit)/tRNA A-37 threonylcarbamoyl transferase component Bud32
MLTLPNYQIHTQIYESANSLVYRGVRKQDNQPVILKVLKEDYPTPEELTRYRQQYEIIHDLNLAGIIKVYEIEKYQNTLVIILEDFGGESLKQLMVDHFFNVKEFLSLAIAIVDSLGNIHAANIIHKDINPANIVWNKTTNQLKIIDFGIASRLPRENPTLKNPEQLEGTLAYISPEQTGRMNRSLDYRTDLYSLGVTFYELLTGKLPFESDSAMELVHCQMAKTPKPVGEINSEVPQIISDIVMKLMAKNVEDRYQSTFGVKADLEQCLENLSGFKNLSGFSFKLAQNDYLGKLQIPQKLYGRENEINTLLQAFERVSQGATEMMLVAGYSGVGKTALVHEVHKPMTSRHGYFASGKFDQFQKNIPYSAITQAFNGFCRYLLMESAETLSNWKTKILDAAGNNGQIIIDVIPELELVIGKQPTVDQVGSTETQNRFQLFFLKFIKALCDKEHPFILFIDDLQWVDSASLSLLKSIMLDDEIHHLLIIGAYRDNEVDSSHSFMMTVDELEKDNVIINTIFLANLLGDDVNHLLQESLLSKAAQTQSLTDLIYQKTLGNAFFTHQFLHTLYVEGLLQFDFKKNQWQWDVEQIASQNMTANVVELMTNKIDQLPKKTSKVLQLAACIGNQFDLAILAIIYEQNQTETLDVLQPAFAEGLILPLDGNYKHVDTLEKSQFKFLHDRIQQAAYALIDDDQKQAVHLQIGRLLLKNTPTDMLENKVFEIVEHFNHSIDLIDNYAERLEISQLNLMAGQKAKMATAHGASIKYLQIGMMLLSSNSWKTDYNLTLNLYVAGTEVAYLSHDFEKMASFANIVLDKAQEIMDKVPVFETMLQAYSVQNQHLDGIHASLTYLHWLGVELPEDPSQEEVGNWLMQTKKLLGDYNQEQLLALPVMTEPLKLAAMRILTRMIPLCFFGKPTLLPLISCAGIKLSLEYGNAPDSPVSYVNYGFVLCTPAIADYTFGYQCGRLATHLLEQQGGKQLAPIVLNNHAALIAIWAEPLRHTFPALKESYQIGIEVGDLEFSFYGMMNYLILVYAAGKNLPYVKEELERYSSVFRHVEYINALILSLYQTVLNLMGEANDPCKLKGAVYNEEQVLPSLLARNNHLESSVYYCNKISLHYLFGQFKEAQQYIELAQTHIYQIAGLHPFIQFCFFAPLVELALTPTFSEEVFQKIECWQQSLKKCAEHAPMNFQHKYDLVEAEKAKVLGQEWQAAKLYDKAIAGAKENKYLHEEALAYELAGQFYLEKGMSKIAQVYLRDAHYAYQRWGAVAKVKNLEAKYSQLLTTQKNLTANMTTSSTVMSLTATRLQTSIVLDLDSVTKASQALAGEIVLSRLLEKMMQIVIENAGAERGLLILEKEKGKSEWVIEAEGTINVDKVAVLQSFPLENRLPLNIVNYVVRTRESLVLANAMQEGIYTQDPYIRQHQLKSVLCSPILHQGQLIGLLYLENNLTEGAFTPARLNVVDMLSSQAAISLENALLYRTLEQKVERRTAQLAQANEKITKANQEITLLNERLKAENMRMSAELDVAKQLQKMVLPKEEELQQIESLDIAGFMEPADEVGGDYYEILNHHGQIKIGIGDVTGHGLESGVLMLMVQTTVRALLLAGIDNPEQFLNIVNQTIYHNAKRMGTDKNLTLSLLDYQGGQLQITGQHEEVLLVSEEGKIERMDTFDLGFSVGLKADIAPLVAHETFSLKKNEGIVLYTDGITEAQNLDEEQYGIERLCEVVSRNWQQTAQQIQQAVIADVRQFIGEQKMFDDITLLVLKQK